MAVGGAQLVVYGAAALALRVLNRGSWPPLMDKAAGGLGKVLWHQEAQSAALRAPETGRVIRFFAADATPAPRSNFKYSVASHQDAVIWRAAGA